MTILATIGRVREAEAEADRIIGEARAEEREKMASALARRREVLEEARRAAGEELRRIEEESEIRLRGEMERVDEGARKECAEIRRRSRANDEAAARSALELFLGEFVKE